MFCFHVKKKKENRAIPRQMCVDHYILLLNHLSLMHFITNGYKRFSKTNSTDQRQSVLLISSKFWTPLCRILATTLCISFCNLQQPSEKLTILGTLDLKVITGFSHPNTKTTAQNKHTHNTVQCSNTWSVHGLVSIDQLASLVRKAYDYYNLQALQNLLNNNVLGGHAINRLFNYNTVS